MQDCLMRDEIESCDYIRDSELCVRVLLFVFRFERKNLFKIKNHFFVTKFTANPISCSRKY